VDGCAEEEGVVRQPGGQCLVWGEALPVFVGEQWQYVCVGGGGGARNSPERAERGLQCRGRERRVGISVSAFSVWLM